MLIRVGDHAAINLEFVRGIKIEGDEAVVFFDGTTSARFDNKGGEFGRLVRALPDGPPPGSPVAVYAQSEVEPPVRPEHRAAPQ